jgi:ferredoxin-NADP reductase/predicted pyridoxine 5'-phosphate oxidase superfamily flavin-nucleotide-binding protein
MMMTATPHASTNNPFHEGEVRAQKLRGVHDHVMSYGPKVIRPFMPDQHREFFSSQPFLVAAIRDESGRMWSTLLLPDDVDPRHHRSSEGGGGWVATSPDPTTLRFTARVARGDALEGRWGSLTKNAPLLDQQPDVGLLGIELGTKRRNRVNGRITSIVDALPDEEASLTSSAATANANSKKHALTFTVDQSFGNCPQYSTPRPWRWQWLPKVALMPNKPPIRGHELTPDQARQIQLADTIFIATGYRGEGVDDNDSFGNDASHRGGQPGFLRVHNWTTLLLPDYSGNNFYNSIGNLFLDPRMGISVPGFETGSLLQMSGTAQVVTGAEAGILYPGIETLIVFTVQNVNELPEGSLPIRWSSESAEKRRVRITSIVRESRDVKSFELEPTQTAHEAPLWKYRAGQYVPVHLNLGREDGPIVRTYSLSRAAHCAVPASSSESRSPPVRYRISVKRHGKGKASRFLHDVLQLGDIVSVEVPTGDFTLKLDEIDHDESPIVLISVGVGVTPVLAMLEELVRSANEAGAGTRLHPRHVIWIHGARNREQHSFRKEVQELLLQSRTLASSRLEVSTFVAYSQPQVGDVLGEDYDVAGRVDLPLLRHALGEGLESGRFYICGPPDFVSAIEEGLQSEGVAPSRIQFESF